MIISALAELPPETRVSITPSAVKKYLKLGFEVSIEKGAGAAAGFDDKAYEIAGAAVITDSKIILRDTNILMSVNPPPINELKRLKPESLVITHIQKTPNNAIVERCLKQRLSLFSMNLIPRISRAQNIDSLTSQANLSGYRSVLEALHYYKRVVPMMMTAGGMIKPTNVLILGAGVAGLQAIATAQRLGAVVYAFDVRKAAKEQVESLGAEFIEVVADEDAETDSGYAGAVSEKYKQDQEKLIDEYAQIADIIICTALIPGKKSPILIPESSVNSMKPGSVIVDLATMNGGNCELSELDKVIQHKGITIVGFSNLARLIPTTASELFANNLFNLISLLSPEPPLLSFNEKDEIIQQAFLTHDGQYLPFQFEKEQ